MKLTKLQPLTTKQLCDVIDACRPQGDNTKTFHGTVVAKMKTKFRNFPPQVMGVFFLSKEQATVMLQSFQLTAKLAEELLAMPEVIEPEVAVAAPQAPKQPAGVVASVNTAKAAASAPGAVTTVAAESIPSLRIVANDGGVQTMSSLDIVEYINHIRKPGVGILRHDNFMTKVPDVLGEKAAPKFQGTAFYTVNGAKREQKVYNFPRKEAIRMAMSYSYDLQAAVLDAWDDAEAKVSKQVAVIPNFDDPVAAAEAWLVERKQSNVLKLELNTATVALEAAQPAIDFTNTVKADKSLYNFLDAATAMDIGRNRLTFVLRKIKHTQMTTNRPYRSIVERGLMTCKLFEFTRDTKYGVKKLIGYDIHITGKGLAYYTPIVKAYLADPNNLIHCIEEVEEVV